MVKMTDETAKWWKGNFPMWFASALLALCCWLGKHGLATIEEELKSNRELIHKLDNSQGIQDTRIVALETQVRMMHEAFVDMRTDFKVVKETQISVLAELKKATTQLEILNKK